MLPVVGAHSFYTLLHSKYLHHHTAPAFSVTAFAILGHPLIMTMRPASSLLRTFARAPAPHTLKASLAEHIPAPAKRLLHTLRTSHGTRPSPVLLSQLRVPPASRRFESSSTAPKQPNTSTTAPDSRLDREQVPSYELTFTCNVCKTRSSHRLSKQGYHKGTILISCPDCKNRHLISDHLKVGKP